MALSVPGRGAAAAHRSRHLCCEGGGVRFTISAAVTAATCAAVCTGATGPVGVAGMTGCCATLAGVSNRPMVDLVALSITGVLFGFGSLLFHVDALHLRTRSGEKWPHVFRRTQIAPYVT